MTLSSDISTTSTALSDIKQAIIDKGVTPSGNITTYAAAISNISTVNNTTLTVTPTTSSQSLTPSSPYTGYSSVSVNAVTSSIDANITAGNIKKDVQILGVTGTYEGSGGGGLIMTDNFYFTHDNGFNLASVTATVGYAISGNYAIALLYDSNGDIIYESPTNIYLCTDFENSYVDRDKDEAVIFIFDADDYPISRSMLHIPLS